MPVTTSETLLPVPYTWSAASTGERGQFFRLYRRREPHSGVVFVGDEQNRTRVAYDASGHAKRSPAALGQIIDLYV